MKRVFLAGAGLVGAGGLGGRSRSAARARTTSAAGLCASALQLDRISISALNGGGGFGQLDLGIGRRRSISPAVSSAAPSATITRSATRCSASKATSIGPTSTDRPPRTAPLGCTHQQLLAFDGARTHWLCGRPVHALRHRRRRVRQHQCLNAGACRRQHDQRRLDGRRRHRIRHHRPLDRQGRISLSSTSANSIAVSNCGGGCVDNVSFTTNILRAGVNYRF